MKLLRYGDVGFEKPGILDSQNQIRDLSGVVGDIDGKFLSSEQFNQISKMDLTSLPLVSGQPRMGACVGSVGNFYCVGLNYRDHAEEMGSSLPVEPVLFSKATSSICGADDVTIIPKGAKQMDWEVELGVVIGKKAKRVNEKEALNYVAGYCLVTDFSERHFQKERGGQWMKGKSSESFGPIGPWLVTKDEISDPQNLPLWLSVDGKRYQDGHSKNMIYSVAYLVSYISEFLVLLPGDVIATGTPAGVGMGYKPEAVYLRVGQEVRLGIPGLGEQCHRMVAES